MRIELPWPPKDLSPNARIHWRKSAAAKRQLRSDWAYCAKAQGVSGIAPQRIHVALTFFPPSRRAYDLDNALARCKAGLDGLADVLGVDDRHWSMSITRGDGVGGKVVVEIDCAE